MAKRAPANEITYNPLDATLAQSVITPIAQTTIQIAESPESSSHRLLGDRQMIDTTNLHSVVNESPVTVHGFTRAKRVLLTPDEDHQAERLVRRIAEQLGTSLKLSHLLRACLAVLSHAEAEILSHAALLAPLKRPANGDPVALAQFEQTIARLLRRAVRDAPPLR